MGETDGAARASLVPTPGALGSSDRGLLPRSEIGARLLQLAGNVVEIPVRGHSMRPLLQCGDWVRIRSGAPPRVGDVVVARTATGMVVHRVVALKGTDVVLAGDSVSRCDAPLPAVQVVGRVLVARRAPMRRLDRGSARAAGRVAATYVRARVALGGRPRRPRAARIIACHQRLSDALEPSPSDEDLLTVRLASPVRTGPARSVDRSGHASFPPVVAPHQTALDARSVRWGVVAERALLGQIGPLVFAGARRCGHGTEFAERALAPLRRQLAGNACRSRRVMHVLDATLARLERIGVPVMAHKGAALALTVYHDPALRIMGDLDLSVRDDHRASAARATRDIREALSRANPDRRSTTGFHVELDGTAHHDIDPARFGAGRWLARSLDWDGVWARARSVPCGRRSILVPCPTDLVIELVANSIRRGFTPVRLIVDIAHTIDRHAHDIDWPLLESELRRTRLDRRSWIAFQLAEIWCGADVPVRLLEPPHDLSTAWYERAMLAWKASHPFARLPTRVLWSGSWTGAVGSGRRMCARAISDRAQRMLPRGKRQVR